MKKIITSIAVATGLALVCASPVAFGEEEENLNASDVPTVVQQAAEKVASGGKIVRWGKGRKELRSRDRNGTARNGAINSTLTAKCEVGTRRARGGEGRALRAGE